MGKHLKLRYDSSISITSITVMDVTDITLKKDTDNEMRETNYIPYKTLIKERESLNFS